VTADQYLADIRTRDASWTANYAHMHRTDGYGQAAADRRKLLEEIERLRSALRGVRSCANCSICQAVARTALDVTTTQTEKTK
jgi:hypothetical protein